jgi:hypothetical protein
MYDPAQRARERIVDAELRKLEIRQALERARRAGCARRETAREPEALRSDHSGGRRAPQA